MIPNDVETMAEQDSGDPVDKAGFVRTFDQKKVGVYFHRLHVLAAAQESGKFGWLNLCDKKRSLKLQHRLGKSRNKQPVFIRCLALKEVC